MQTHLSDHLPSIVMPKLTVNNAVHHLAGLTKLLQQPLDGLLDKSQRWAESHLSTVAILAPFGTPPWPAGRLRWLCLSRCLTGLLHWFGHHRVRRTALDT